MSHTYGVICSTCGEHVSEPGDCPEGCKFPHGYTFVSGEAMTNMHQCPPCECDYFTGPVIECPIHGAACEEEGCYKHGGPHSPCHDKTHHKCQWFNKGKCVECGAPNPLIEVSLPDWTDEQKDKAFKDFNEKFADVGAALQKFSTTVTFKTPNPAIIELLTGQKIKRDETLPLAERYPEYKKGLDID